MPLFKLMLAGDVSTGKTSFLTQLVYQTAQRNPVPTQTLGFFAMKFHNPNAQLQIWDAPGDPRQHFQVISSLEPFTALLVFVDITNAHTFTCARTLIQEIRCYPHLQVHLVESKVELTRKDPIKRKVATHQLQSLATAVGGCLFCYERDQPVEPIIHTVIAWKTPQQAKIDKIKKTDMGQQQNCDCSIF